MKNKPQHYEYSGYLKTILHAPDHKIRDTLPQIVFTTEDLSHWQLVDDENEKEWQHIPARRERTESGVILQGNFEDVRHIDNLTEDDPSFWVAISSRLQQDDRFPINLNEYPIIEITYRCHSQHARPAWIAHYPGGVQFDGLQPTPEWRTIVRRVQHFGFPTLFTALTFRLYSTARSTESFEIGEVRFRAMSDGEREGCLKNEAKLQHAGAPKTYPVLEEFLPLGVFMKAGAAKRLADLMEISFRDYWRLALEDIARHHHNVVALEEIDQLSDGEWRELLGLSEAVGIRILAIHHWPLENFSRQGPELVAKYVQPYANSDAVLGWMIHGEPPDHSFQAHLQARKFIEEADPNHPMAVLMRDANSFSLFGQFFPVTGISHFKSKAAWDLGRLVRTHYPLSRGQQFWVVAPAFVYATDTPEWYTCPEMRMMVNHSFANGARGWLAFTYHNDPVWLGGNCERSLTGPFLTFSDLWSELGHRMERFIGLAPLFLNAKPIESADLGVNVTWQLHPRTKLPPGWPSIHSFWMEGPDYRLLYLISSDINEVTPVNVEIDDARMTGLEVYDVTDFTRSRNWLPMERRRHLEMFPGQGHLILFAEPAVADQWRHQIVDRMIANDRRQISLDLSLARRYDLDISGIQQLMQNVGMGNNLEDLQKMQAVRDQLLNSIYASPTIVAPRSRIIQISATVCACDGTLCRLMNTGKIDLAQEMGLKVPPSTRELSQLRLNLRRGKGTEITQQADDLFRRAQRVMAEIKSI